MDKEYFLNPTIEEYEASSLAFDLVGYLQREGVGIDDMITITSLMLTIQCGLKDKREDLPDGTAINTVVKGILQSADVITKEDAEYIYVHHCKPQTEEKGEQESCVQTDKDNASLEITVSNENSN